MMLSFCTLMWLLWAQWAFEKSEPPEIYGMVRGAGS